MPNIARRQIVQTLEASLKALPEQDPEAVFKRALAEAGLKDKPFFTPEETALVARAVMERAQADMQAAAAVTEETMAELAAEEPDQEA